MIDQLHQEAKTLLPVLLLGSHPYGSVRVILLFCHNSRNWQMMNLLVCCLETEDLPSTKARKVHLLEMGCSAEATLPDKRPSQNAKPLQRTPGLLVHLCWVEIKPKHWTVNPLLREQDLHAALMAMAPSSSTALQRESVW
jgi:hypothetical protein